MATFRSPGVFILEPPSFPPSIVAVETAIPVFIGFTEKIPDSNSDDPLKPTKVANLEEFEGLFGSINHSADFRCSINLTRDAGGEITDIRYIIDPVNAESVFRYNLYHSIEYYFINGGGPCYIISVGLHTNNVNKPFSLHEKPDESGSFSWIDAIESAEQEDDITLFVVPELVYTADIDNPANYAGTYDAALRQSFDRKDRFVIVDVPQMATGGISERANAQMDVDTFRDKFANFLPDARKFGASYYPYLTISIDAASLSSDNEGNILTPLTITETDSEGQESTNDSFDTVGELKGNLEFDGVFQSIKNDLASTQFSLPPSPAIAGIYATVDNDRGVFKAPANVTVSSLIKAERKIDNSLQDGMNVHPSGLSVNPVRLITDRGTVVWGARTLDANNLDFRYINVRRFFNFVEESVKKAMYRFVFEPNDANTWTPIRASIENFLTVQWGAGALQGAKADDAFFVQVGLGQTMTPQDISEGKLKVRIGMAVVRPAEFIILEFTQFLPVS